MTHIWGMNTLNRLLWAALALAPAWAGAADRPAWHASWMAAPQPVWDASFVLPLGMPRTLEDVTLRQWLRTSVGGSRVRVVVSNEHGTMPVVIGRAAIQPAGAAPAVPLTFRGRPRTVLAAGARQLSDPVALAVTAGERLRIDVYLPTRTSPGGFHWEGRETTQLIPGDAVGGDAPRPADTVTTRAFVTGLQVESAAVRATVVAIGDSITDGNAATPGRDQRWPDHLATRLAPHGVAVLNAGISGNRLLRGGMGQSALRRFDRDVLRHRGVRTVVVVLGTNDIGWPGGAFAPREPLPAPGALTAGLRQLVAQAHARGVRVVGGTVPPFEGALQGTPLEGHYSPEKDALRQALNAWIRRSGTFDAVVDFDAVLRDPARPSRLNPAFDSGDHLHPGDAGYRAMADALRLEDLLPSTEAPR
jgi:lysophospholipase L1-like esterase